MFKKLREVCRKHFHLVAPPKTSVVTSYDQKTTPGVLMVPVVLLFLLVSEAPGPEIQILREISSPEPPQNHPGTTSTKTHSGDSDGTGGSGVSGGFPGPWP